LTIKIASSQNIFNVAGTGVPGYTGDGGSALSANVYPEAIAIDGVGNLYIAERMNCTVRKIDTTGIIKTIAGTGSPGYSGDGGAAISAKLNEPMGVAVDNLGNIYISDSGNDRIRKVDTNGIISTIAGPGSWGNLGDNGSAISANLDEPRGITIDQSGNIYFTDMLHYRVRKIDASGIITTVAGNGNDLHSGDGGPATAATMSYPLYLYLDASSNLFVSTADWRIRKISAGVITTVGGDGTSLNSIDGSIATAASIHAAGLTKDKFGNIVFADYGCLVRKINAVGLLVTAVGVYDSCTYYGTGVPSNTALTNRPIGIVTDPFGNIYFTENFRVRVICDNNCPSYVGINEKNVSEYLRVFPNPVYETLSIRGSFLKNDEFELSDSVGKNILKRNLLGEDTKIDLRECPAGMYYYSILRKGEAISKGKLAIQR
jgi:sugar lactone lactonase YvrE